jgi:hypothetical protein
MSLITGKNLNYAGYIYFLDDLDKNLVKIGRTNCIYRRLKEHSRNFKFKIIQVIFSENRFKTEKLLIDFYKENEIESERFDLNDKEILKIKSLDLPKEILKSLSSDGPYVEDNPDNLFFMKQLSQEAIDAIEKNGYVDDLRSYQGLKEAEVYVLRKMIYEPDRAGLEFTKEYMDRLEQILCVAAYWEQSGFNASGLSFQEIFDDKVVELSLLPKEPRDNYQKDKLLSIKKALDKGMDDQEIIDILNLEKEQYENYKKFIS